MYQYNPREDFIQFWGWYAVIDDITDGDVFKEDEVWEWNVVRFLNRLSFLKDKKQLILEELNGIRGGNI